MLNPYDFGPWVEQGDSSLSGFPGKDSFVTTLRFIQRLVNDDDFTASFDASEALKSYIDTSLGAALARLLIDMESEKVSDRGWYSRHVNRMGAILQQVPADYGAIGSLEFTRRAMSEAGEPGHMELAMLFLILACLVIKVMIITCAVYGSKVKTGKDEMVRLGIEDIGALRDALELFETHVTTR